MKTKPSVTQKITLTIQGKVIELSKDEAMEVARQLDEVTGRKLPVPAPIIIEKEVRHLRDRDWPRPMQPYFGDPPPHTWWTSPTCVVGDQLTRLNG